MQQAWNARARADAVFYVESYHASDRDGFFARGEERAAQFLDPVLARTFRDARRLHVLEIGCGLGRFSRALARRFERVTAIDVSDEMVSQAKAANAPWGNIEFRASDGESIPLPPQSVDFAFSYEVFQHMPSHRVIQANLREVGRVLRHGGAAMIHLRTGGMSQQILYRLADVVPARVHAALKRMRGKRSLTSDATWRGAPPLSQPQIERMARAAGLSVAEFLPDPTHGAGTRVFAIMTPGGR
ncbi:class I SAM-dependent methyltransferase [Phenylobacterium sp.]|uniref:class I SAM-dependent methyltransferase n=1 Tax=Phenylobacterium sp. TaxID=1871053 RepID=UPI002B73383F|nr:methyltransferase domain-containing protein [Phenylobacterium sp.]HVI30564.1 methyltransferase domain-containing protein [Phenylobacterium sp.]